jgi:uncharacterized membrane protein
VTFAAHHPKGLHRLFLFSIWVKGISGLLEAATGILVIFISPRVLENLVVFLTAPELSEDPDDALARYLAGAVHRYSTDTQGFLATYLILHGAIRVFLVGALLAKKRWAYPVSLAALGSFIVYQAYRFTLTHSVWLLMLTIVDLVVAYLIWEEYRRPRPATPGARG